MKMKLVCICIISLCLVSCNQGKQDNLSRIILSIADETNKLADSFKLKDKDKIMNAMTVFLEKVSLLQQEQIAVLTEMNVYDGKAVVLPVEYEFEKNKLVQAIRNLSLVLPNTIDFSTDQAFIDKLAEITKLNL